MPTPGVRRPLAILLLGDDRPNHAQNLLDHLGAFGRYSRHRVSLYNPRALRAHPHLDLDAFDVVVVHWSLVVVSDTYLSPDLREKIRRFRGLKIQFLQDEYRLVDEVTAMLRQLEIDALFTVAPSEAAQKLYESRLPDVEIVPTLPGFVSDELAERRTPPLEARPIDVGYRGRAVPPWLGKLGREKVEIGKRFLREAEGTGLRCDIAWTEPDRLYGERWNRFLASCRTSLGTESGASIADFDGSVELEVLEYLEKRPEASFDDIHRNVLEPYEGNVVIRVMPPRVLEAAALRTGLVLFAGSYSDVLRPWTNYVPLEKDFSNFDAVVEAVRNLPMLGEMTERNHDELVASGRFSLKSFVEGFDVFVEERATAVATASPARYQRSRVRRVLATRTVLGVELGERRRALIELGGTARILARDDAIRRFVTATLADHSLRQKFGLRRICMDSVRLAAMRRAHKGRPFGPMPFAVIPSLDLEDGSLTFVSLTRGVWHRDSDFEQTATRVRSALQHRDVSTVIWNHHPAGPTFGYRTMLGRTVHLPVGYLGLEGMYQFGALSELARRRPDVVWAATESLTGQPVRRVRSRAELLSARLLGTRLRRARRLRRELRLLLRPGYVLRAVLLTRAAVVDPVIRQLLVHGIARHDILYSSVLRDALRLHALSEAMRGNVPEIGDVEVTVRDGQTLFVSVPAERDRNGRRRSGALLCGDLVWDNSAVGPFVRVSAFGANERLPLGVDGWWDFPAARRVFAGEKAGRRRG